MATDDPDRPVRRTLGLSPRPAQEPEPPAPPAQRAAQPQPDPAPTEGRKSKIGAGMADSKQNLQDVFLNHVRKSKVPVTIFLINGVKLQGVITWFDSFCVLLRRDGQSQLVYKSAISTIMPSQPIQLYDGDDAA